MSTILRVKRRLNESPHEALLIHCKRLKTESVDTVDAVQPSLFIFSGTIGEKETPPDIEKIKSKLKNSLQNKKLCDIPSILSRLRHDRVEQSQAKRFQILNYNRGIFTDSKENVDNEHRYLDIEQKNVSQPDKVDNNSEYAYDLYLLNKENDVELQDVESILRIDSLNADLVYGESNQNNPDFESSGESEDSNDENNFRNDYPDTPDGSIGEDDMVAVMEKCDIGYDLSSDDDLVVYDEKLSKNDLKLNNDDVERYGLAYATYKAKVTTVGDHLQPQSSVNASQLLHFDDRNESFHNSGYKDIESEDEFYYGKDDDIDCERSERQRSDSFSSDD